MSSCARSTARPPRPPSEMRFMVDDTVARLRREVVEPLKKRFVGRDEIVDLMVLAVTAGEHLFLHGPPGTAKSALIRQFALAVRASYFEYLLTRFSEPNEVFGPIDLVRLREGTVATVTTGMLPEGEFVFLDELFNANSAILNNLLTVLNERLYRRGAEVHQLPLLVAVRGVQPPARGRGAAGLVRPIPASLPCRQPQTRGDATPAPRPAGTWSKPARSSLPSRRTISAPGAASLPGRAGGIAERYADVVSKVRDLGVAFSDRRAVKVLKLVAASAVLCGAPRPAFPTSGCSATSGTARSRVAPLTALVAGVIEPHAAEPDAHPLAAVPNRVDGEEIARQLDAIAAGLKDRSLSLAAAARFREQLGTLADSAAWLADEPARRHLVDKIGELSRRLGLGRPTASQST